MKHIYKCYILFVCTMLMGIVVILTGCPSSIATNSIDADSSEEYTILPQFAEFPVIASSVSADREKLVVEWTETYPAIKEYDEVIAVFPHSIEGWHISDPRFQFNTEYNLLEWRAIRRRGAYLLDIFDENNELRYEVVVISSIASQFLDEVYTSIAGESAMLEEWWVSAKMPEYFYVGGNDTDNTWVGHQVIFVAQSGGTLNEHAILKSKAIEKGEIVDELYTMPSSMESQTVNINAIVQDLNDREAELCVPPEGAATYAYTHEYVVTRSKVVEERLRALNGSQDFLLLQRESQRSCFTSAYLFEILPSEKLVTTEAYRDSLPDGMRYARAQYDLVFNEDYEDETLQDLYDRNYFIGVVGAEVRDPIGGNRNPYLYDATPYTHDDPIKVEDGKLFVGYGLRSKYDNANQRNKYECDPDKLIDPIESLNPDKCNARSWVDKMILPYYFKYGFLEIEYARTPVYGNGMYVWLSSYVNTLVLDSGSREYHYVDQKSAEYGTPLRRVYNAASNLRWESTFFASELELMEMNLQYSSPFYWTVNHYGASYTDSGNARFFYKFSRSNFPLASRYAYGIEWSPDGYIIWIKKLGVNWTKHSEQKFTGLGNNGGSHICRTDTKESPKTIDGVSGIVPCGINHAPMKLIFQGSGAPNYFKNPKHFEDYFKAERTNVRLADRLTEIEHIRLYKPRNNYANIDPVYK